MNFSPHAARICRSQHESWALCHGTSLSAATHSDLPRPDALPPRLTPARLTQHSRLRQLRLPCPFNQVFAAVLSRLRSCLRADVILAYRFARSNKSTLGKKGCACTDPRRRSPRSRPAQASPPANATRQDIWVISSRTQTEPSSSSLARRVFVHYSVPGRLQPGFVEVIKDPPVTSQRYATLP